ncbi:TPA: IS982 family transposase, partial [Legionella pneumophila]|nr:IS982 family transposase [Legionella pneumophila]HAU0242144.1 IS982 family transposase [Legionella pneumophila]HAU2306511.1 IS982 family transposase [Legionella pneumophila]HAU2321941.1 IS982 family transposase [Legionella pneumophila]HAU3790582.1 IS982 family transposase [Legionella pneumophila]
MDKLIELFCVVDDFCQKYMPRFEQHLINISGKTRRKPCSMSMSEIMTIVIHYHQSNYRNFKSYYLFVLQKNLHPYFPSLVSYSRMTELMSSCLVPLMAFCHHQTKTPTGIYFVDSTPIEVCNVKRASQNKVFKGLAEKSKSTMGWYFGFKLHLIVNDKGELMAFKITSSRTDDRFVVPNLSENLFGKMIGDKGYISQNLTDKLAERGLQLLTKARKNMKQKVLNTFDKALLRKRAIVESVIDQLKNISNIEHSRHRSIFNFMVNILAGLAAYALK